MGNMMNPQPESDSAEAERAALYAAFKAHDTRFDGRAFIGVSSTGIYCRPVCSARMPKYENCHFFHSAAEAEAAGYRPCLICRPEIAPGMSNADASANLARRAAKLLRENCTADQGIEQFAAQLGYTSRHLRRVFEEEYGISPISYLQTCRLLLAKSLLTDSGLPIASVAKAAGFGSVRRMNTLFKEHYHLTPSDLRKRSKAPAGEVIVKLGYRAPYRFDKLLDFFRLRALPGVEVVGDDYYARTARIPLPDGGFAEGWLRIANDPKKNTLVLAASETLTPALPQLIARIRHQFDLDCNPQAVHEGISQLDQVVPGAAVPGTRLPGCFDPFETACRAVLGQQISVLAANKLAARIVENYGTPIETGIDGLTHAFPTPEEVLHLGNLEDALGRLGVIKTRSRVIGSIAQLIVDGTLDFTAGADMHEQMETLLAIKGVGPWTANYIAMRALGNPDAFLESDAGVKHALPNRTPKEIAALAEAWRPWRSYANICLWNSLG